MALLAWVGARKIDAGLSDTAGGRQRLKTLVFGALYIELVRLPQTMMRCDTVWKASAQTLRTHTVGHTRVVFLCSYSQHATYNFLKSLDTYYVLEAFKLKPGDPEMAHKLKSPPEQ